MIPDGKKHQKNIVSLGAFLWHLNLEKQLHVRQVAIFQVLDEALLEDLALAVVLALLTDIAGLQQHLLPVLGLYEN